MKFWSALIACLSLVCHVQAATFSNPLKGFEGSDPFIVTFEGYYYLLTTTWEDVQITRATTLEGLKTGETKVVWADSEPSRCCWVWAPEVHYIGGTWYLYYTAGRSQDVSQQNVHVLRGGATPWDDWQYAGQMTSEWGIDATVIRFNQLGEYLVYSCFPEPDLQSLCIAHLDSPTSLGPRTVISRPTEDWETIGAPPAVNEGPAALYYGGQTFLVYSASFCATVDYSLAYLLWNGGDPLQASSWSKRGPLFSSANGNYGTAHNGFFTSFDGSEIWNVYHATSNSGGSCGRDRYTMAQIVNWNADGTPNFGTPVAQGVVLQGPSGE